MSKAPRIPRGRCAARLLAAASLVSLFAANAQGQNATYTFFGTPARVGCGPFSAFVQHTATGTPQLGSNFTINMPASNGDCGYLCNLWFVATGFSNTSFQGVPLPFTPGPFQSSLPSCGSLRVSLDHIDFTTPTATSTSAQVNLAIPNNPNLVGLEFFQQPFVLTYILGGISTIALGRAGHGTIGY